MKKIDIKKAAGVSVLSLGLVVGLAGFAGATSGTIGTTGPDSTNKITHKTKVDTHVKNDNNLGLTNRNNQHASSGRVEVEHNTTGGDAKSGRASNANAVNATVEVNNSHAAASVGGAGGAGGSNTGSINNTGPDSVNKVKFESRTNVNISNDNDVNICNDNEQSATSGSAEVQGNTRGGDATSGDASNTNSSSFAVRITN